MNTKNLVQHSKEFPESVQDNLRRIAERHSVQGGSSNDFEEQIRRLVAKELKPRSMFLDVRELPGGRIRFTIRDSETHSFIHMLDYFPQSKRDPAKTGYGV